MCELFSMSSRFPANVRFSLEEFSTHGGLKGPHKDGWGIAYYVDGDVRLVKEPEPAADSACVRFIQEHPFRTTIAVSHIRLATLGPVAMRNCQPFVRELGGRMHVFAHNGDLSPTGEPMTLPLGEFRPIGETDSEHAFCALLGRLAAPWRHDGVPSLDRRLAIVAAFAEELRALGPANFIYSDGEAVFIHGHKRSHSGTPRVRPPGLHVLCRRCSGDEDHKGISTRGLAIASESDQRVVIAASVPLTDEPGWQALAEGEVVVAQLGEIVRRVV